MMLMYVYTMIYSNITMVNLELYAQSTLRNAIKYERNNLTNLSKYLGILDLNLD